MIVQDPHFRLRKFLLFDDDFLLDRLSMSVPDCLFKSLVLFSELHLVALILLLLEVFLQIVRPFLVKLLRSFEVSTLVEHSGLVSDPLMHNS